MTSKAAISKAAVVGAGLMGSAIARHMAANGMSVLLIDNDNAQLEKASQSIDKLPITTATSTEQLTDEQYVIEAVFEDIDVKRDVLKQVSQAVTPDCILATNTSSLLVSDIAEGINGANRFLGVHYNNPADVNPVVEIIATTDTDESCATEIYNWMNQAKKLPIRCADTTGFILNRQSLPYINEAARCLDIATPGEVDFVATRQLGVGLGPFAVMNLVGLPVMAAASRNLSTLGEGYRPAEPLQILAEDDDPTWEIIEVTRVGDALSEEIAERLMGAMIFPGKDILDNNLTSRDELHTICTVALGYQRSSPELIEELDKGTVNHLIDAYLERQL